jgi:hypothetical protein
MSPRRRRRARDRLDGPVDRHRRRRSHQVDRAAEAAARGDVHGERGEREDGVDNDDQLGRRRLDPPQEREQRD